VQETLQTTRETTRETTEGGPRPGPRLPPGPPVTEAPLGRPAKLGYIGGVAWLHAEVDRDLAERLEYGGDHPWISANGTSALSAHALTLDAEPLTAALIGAEHAPDARTRGR
jgi:hypothetical protein